MSGGMGSRWRAGAVALRLAFATAAATAGLAVGARAQTMDDGGIDLRCEHKVLYEMVFEDAMAKACDELKAKATQYMLLAKDALPPPSRSSWLSWLSSPQCNDEKSKEFEAAALALIQTIDAQLTTAHELNVRAKDLMKSAKEMNSSHNAKIAVSIADRAVVYVHMVEDTWKIVPAIHIEYADRALKAKCYPQADKAYRFIVEHYTSADHTALRQRAQIGIDDVRAKDR